MTGAAEKPRRALVRTVFLLGLAVNILVCIPFLFDPFGWLQGGEAGASVQTGPVEVVVFLREGHDPGPLQAFLEAHPQAEPLHRGGLFDTLSLRIAANAPATLAALERQPFARLVLRNGAVFCQ